MNEQSAQLKAGSWLHNPVTGELAEVLVGPADTDGRRVKADLWLQPGAAVAGAHIHDHLIERFTVIEGDVAFVLDGDEREAKSGEAAVEVPAGTSHDWWNAGDGIARVRVEVESTPGSVGAPAARFVSMIETMWSLGALGNVNSKGMPSLLWLGAVAREYRDVLRFTKPPMFVQAILFAPIAALAKATGRNPLDPGLHGVGAACEIEAPDEAGLARLLSGSAGKQGRVNK